MKRAGTSIHVKYCFSSSFLLSHFFSSLTIKYVHIMIIMSVSWKNIFLIWCESDSFHLSSISALHYFSYYLSCGYIPNIDWRIFSSLSCNTGVSRFINVHSFNIIIVTNSTFSFYISCTEILLFIFWNIHHNSNSSSHISNLILFICPKNILSWIFTSISINILKL